MSQYIWLFCLMVTHIVAYYMGRADAERREPSEDAWVEVEKYEIDKKYAFAAWLEERKDTHGS